VSCSRRRNVVQIVQNVQAVQAPSFILPRDAGEERGEGLNVLNGWNDLNEEAEVRDINVTV
jgi:hypothetical protein